MTGLSVFLVELIVIRFEYFFDNSVAIVAHQIFEGRFACNETLRGHIIHKLAEIELIPLLALIVNKRAEASNAAYDVLKDEHKREVYDQYGLEGLKEGMGAGGTGSIFPYSYICISCF